MDGEIGMERDVDMSGGCLASRTKDFLAHCFLNDVPLCVNKFAGPLHLQGNCFTGS